MTKTYPPRGLQSGVPEQLRRVAETQEMGVTPSSHGAKVTAACFSKLSHVWERVRARNGGPLKPQPSDPNPNLVDPLNL